jgi:hypothetical protein
VFCRFLDKFRVFFEMGVSRAQNFLWQKGGFFMFFQKSDPKSRSKNDRFAYVLPIFRLKKWSKSWFFQKKSEILQNWVVKIVFFDKIFYLLIWAKRFHLLRHFRFFNFSVFRFLDLTVSTKSFFLKFIIAEMKKSSLATIYKNGFWRKFDFFWSGFWKFMTTDEFLKSESRDKKRFYGKNDKFPLFVAKMLKS